MPYKIAVASTDGEAVDAHFGQACSFYIYEVDNAGGYSQTELRSVRPQSEAHGGCWEGGGRVGGGGGGRGCRHDEQGIKPVAEALSDCRYVLTAQIGKRPQMLLKRAGITALESPPELSAAIGKLHKYHIKTNRKENLNER